MGCLVAGLLVAIGLAITGIGTYLAINGNVVLGILAIVIGVLVMVFSGQIAKAVEF